MAGCYGKNGNVIIAMGTILTVATLLFVLTLPVVVLLIGT